MSSFDGARLPQPGRRRCRRPRRRRRPRRVEEWKDGSSSGHRARRRPGKVAEPMCALARGTLPGSLSLVRSRGTRRRRRGTSRGLTGERSPFARSDRWRCSRWPATSFSETLARCEISIAERGRPSSASRMAARTGVARSGVGAGALAGTNGRMPRGVGCVQSGVAPGAAPRYDPAVILSHAIVALLLLGFPLWDRWEVRHVREARSAAVKTWSFVRAICGLWAAAFLVALTTPCGRGCLAAPAVRSPPSLQARDPVCSSPARRSSSPSRSASRSPSSSRRCTAPRASASRRRSPRWRTSSRRATASAPSSRSSRSRPAAARS